MTEVRLQCTHGRGRGTNVTGRGRGRHPLPAAPGFSGIRVEVTVAGPESEERYAELAAAVDDHCPVLDLFKNPVPVSRALSP